MPSPTHHPRDPLHGITLEHLLKQLVARHGWAELGRRIPIRCFLFDPSVNSSLKFLRKTPWARQRVEDWFIQELRLPSGAHPPARSARLPNPAGAPRLRGTSQPPRRAVSRGRSQGLRRDAPGRVGAELT